MSVRVRTSKGRRSMRRITLALEGAREAHAQAFRELANETFRRIVTLTPVKSGRLKGRWMLRRSEETPERVRIVAVNDQPYAQAVEFRQPTRATGQPARMVQTALAELKEKLASGGRYGGIQLRS